MAGLKTVECADKRPGNCLANERLKTPILDYRYIRRTCIVIKWGFLERIGKGTQ
jgi:hypothetical protein